MFLAVGEHLLERIDPQSQRMTNLFAGGLGGSHEEMCGALAGAILAMSALLGRTDCHTDDKDAMALAKRYRELFLAELGHTQCAPLREWARGPQGTGSCRPLVERAATILLQLLEPHQGELQWIDK